MRPAEAVAVVRELALRASRGELPGLPSAHVLRFGGEGEILIEGPVAAGCSVKRAARLLEAMLPGFDAPPELRVSGALRLVMARALGTLDLPPYRTLEDFAEALARFAAPDAAAMVRDLLARCSVALEEQAQPPAVLKQLNAGELTISDVRRARRATGLTLSEIADRSRIPVSLLRELEWGYFINWPAGQYGRTQLVRYARAAGLDEQVIVGAVLPEIESSWRAPVPTTEQVIEAAVIAEEAVVIRERTEEQGEEPAALVRIDHDPVATRHKRSSRRWAAALAIPALLAVALVPAMWEAAEPDAPPATIDGNRSSARLEVPPPPSDPPAAQAEKLEVAGADGAVELPPHPVPDPGRETDSRESDSGAEDPRPLLRPAALRADAAFSPAFASVGSAMFYHSEADGASTIMRADTDSSGAVLRVTSIVDDNSRNFHARPSPDGEYIAFDSDRDGERAVYVAEASGRNVRRVTGDGFAAVPSWSPDGRMLAFVRAEPRNPKVWNLWIVDLESGETRRLTSHRVGQPWGGAWFPDGRRIAYSHESRLIVKALDGGPDRVYPAPKKNGWLRTPAVSPDGKRIVFQLHGDGTWLLDLPDGSMRKILSDRTAEEFTWSPDGRRIAYHSRRTGKWGVWVMAHR